MPKISFISFYYQRYHCNSVKFFYKVCYLFSCCSCCCCFNSCCFLL